jgi:hypothetical protein
MSKNILFLSLDLPRALLSFFRKKVMVFLLLACMMINGFVPSTLEISKYSLVMIVAVATQNAVTQIFVKCNDSIAGISDATRKRICSILFDTGKETPVSPSEKEGTRNTNNNANNDTAIISQSTAQEKRKMILDFNGSLQNFSVFTVEMFKLYENRKTPDKNCCTALLFLIFIAAVVRRKDISENEINKINIWKKQISA